VPRPALEVADVFREHGPTWRKANVGHVSLVQLKVMSAIESCRTATLGGHVMRCEDCTPTLIAYNSCRNCPIPFQLLRHLNTPNLSSRPVKKHQNSGNCFYRGKICLLRRRQSEFRHAELSGPEGMMMHPRRMSTTRQKRLNEGCLPIAAKCAYPEALPTRLYRACRNLCSRRVICARIPHICDQLRKSHRRSLFATRTSKPSRGPIS
jgi:hypothetical protein